jgi:hypothetical protein
MSAESSPRHILEFLRSGNSHLNAAGVHSNTVKDHSFWRTVRFSHLNAAGVHSLYPTIIYGYR